MGIDSILTRDKDKQIALEKRCKIANKKKADAFVSLHRNSADGAKGVEIWVRSDMPVKDTALAESILSGLDEVGISKKKATHTSRSKTDVSNMKSR